MQPTAAAWTRGQYITLATLDTKYLSTKDSFGFPLVDNAALSTTESIAGIGWVMKDTGIVRVWLYNNISRNSAINGSVTYILS